MFDAVVAATVAAALRIFRVLLGLGVRFRHAAAAVEVVRPGFE